MFSCMVLSYVVGVLFVSSFFGVGVAFSFFWVFCVFCVEVGFVFFYFRWVGFVWVLLLLLM